MNVLSFLFVACCWGGSFIAIKPLVEAMPPLMAGTLRIWIGLAFLAVALPLMRIPLGVPQEARRRLWLTGVVAFCIPFSLLFWGERSISPGLAGILNGTVPIWVFILGIVFTPGAEPVSLKQVAGLALGILGVSAIFLPKVLEAETDPSFGGTVAVTGMALSYAAGVLMNRAVLSRHPGVHPYSNLFQQLIAGGLSMLAVAIAIEGVPQPSTWRPLSTVVVATLYLGCVSTGLAFMVFYRLIRAWGSVRAATVTYVVPTVALGFDLALNSHLPRANELAGVLGVTAGVVILNWPRRRPA